MFGTSASSFLWQNLKIRIDETAQSLRILVVNFFNIINTKIALLFFFYTVFHTKINYFERNEKSQIINRANYL